MLIVTLTRLMLPLFQNKSTLLFKRNLIMLVWIIKATAEEQSTWDENRGRLS